MHGSKRKRRLWTIPAAFILLFVFLFYGPVKPIRVLWITTAEHSANFKFLARWLYTDDYIQRILEENSVYTDERPDTALIGSGSSEEAELAEIKGQYFQGYIIRVGDPSRLRLAVSGSRKGMLLEELAAAHDASGGINAGGFRNDAQGVPAGYCVADGEVMVPAGPEPQHSIIALTAQHTLVTGIYSPEELQHADFLWAVEFGPALIVNGENVPAAQFSGGLTPRTAIGQTQQGDILLLVIDGRRTDSLGATYADVQMVLAANGAVNAAVLDGGSSSSMLFEGEIVNNPCGTKASRQLPNAILF